MRYFIVYLYGSIIGSFLNVCIYRLPAGDDIVMEHSHCMSCGHRLKWLDMIPVLSWLFLRGRCRYCKERISVQYPLVEAMNGILWAVTVAIYGFTIESLLYCLLISALLVLSVIDWRTYEIPFGINLFIFLVGLIHFVLHLGEWKTWLIGFFCVSLFLFLLFYLTKGRGIGGGDVKLMAAAGFLLGWRLVLVAFFLGCLYGVVIHLFRMRVCGASNVLALGPYLSAGILTAVWFGEALIQWYLALF